jgi:AhpD family alkylhydroperoxidase
MKHPAFLVPGVMDALQALAKATGDEVLPAVTRKLVQLRASQINGCSQCVDMHAKEMKKAGETEERIIAVGAWRHAPYFTDAERAALALTEALTRLADQSDPVPDALWSEVSRLYDERSLAALIVSIANINVWNRLNAAVGQVAGAKWA